ncbi:hypothetical protein [Rhodopirellula sallentina]|uniref:Uncharacterized protein n=1 Tax=Rhodopirellula sallentina SM41 TaxID=1263870 RepID=M5U453_9BACT|nr:hypothetical protein [Rhodopirellula sallentina]EMI56227.1 hypothetical protein RSSM_02323 [Rhodopirellula sallentina SM41]
MRIFHKIHYSKEDWQKLLALIHQPGDDRTTMPLGFGGLKSDESSQGVWLVGHGCGRTR